MQVVLFSQSDIKQEFCSSIFHLMFGKEKKCKDHKGKCSLTKRTKEHCPIKFDVVLISMASGTLPMVLTCMGSIHSLHTHLENVKEAH